MASTSRIPLSNDTTKIRTASGSTSRPRDYPSHSAEDPYPTYDDRPHLGYPAPYPSHPTHHAHIYHDRRTAFDWAVHAKMQDAQFDASAEPSTARPTYGGLAYDQPRHPLQHDIQPTEPIPRSTNISSLVYDPNYVIAMHDFSPQSGNASCLTFRAGEVIHVLNRDATGWWDGEIDGRRGWFPSNYVSKDVAAFAAAAELAGFAAVTDEDTTPQMQQVEELERHSSTTRRVRSRRNRPSTPTTDPSDSSEAFVERRESCPPMMVPMVHALALLRNAVSANRVTHFQPSTACIISCVRSVLSTCECLSKDSAHLLRFPTLAYQRKRVLAELARLVSQAKQASDNGHAAKTAAPGRGSIAPERVRELQEMVRLGDLVFHQVHKFLTLAIECGIDLPPDRMFAGAPGLEEASGNVTSGGEEWGPSSSGANEPPHAHARKSSSTSALPRKTSISTKRESMPNEAEQSDGERNETSPRSPRPDGSSNSPPNVHAESPRLASRGRESPSSTSRPKSTGDLRRRSSVSDMGPPREPSSPVQPAGEHSRRIPTQRHVSLRKRSTTFSSPARDAAAPYRKPKYSISSVSSLSSYESSQPDTASPTSESSFFPSGSCSTSQALATLRTTHDKLLSVIAAFIGHIHSYSRSSHASSQGHLIDMTRKTVDQVRFLLTLVDAVEEHPVIRHTKPREMAALKVARVSLYNCTNEIVQAIKSVMSPIPEAASEEEEKARALQAATGTLRAGGDCVKSIHMCLSTKIGEEPFVINIATVPAADTPTHTSPPSATSSRASSSPPSTPRSATSRRTHSNSLSQVPSRASGSRAKSLSISHSSSASASSSSAARRRPRAQSDVSPLREAGHVRFPEHPVEDVPEDVNEDPGDQDPGDQGPGDGEVEGEVEGEGEKTVMVPQQDVEELEVPDVPEAVEVVEDDEETPFVATPEESDPSPVPIETVSDPPAAEFVSPRSSGSTEMSKSTAAETTTTQTSVDVIGSPTTESDEESDDGSSADEDELESKPLPALVEEDAQEEAAVEEPTPEPASSLAPPSASEEMKEIPSSTSALEEKLIHGELPATPSAPPEFVDALYDPRDLFVNEAQQLIAASLEVMVIKIAPLSFTPDRSFVVAFLLTFRLFTTPAKLVEALIRRWNVEPAVGWPTSERTDFETKLPFMRIRVARCIKTWIDHYWIPESDDEVLPQLQQLVDQPLPPDADVSLSNIVVVIRSLVYGELMRFKRGGSRPMDRMRSAAHLIPRGIGDGPLPPPPSATGDMPAPLLKRTRLDSETVITDVEPLEAARQLTLMEAKLFCDIPAQELVELGKAGAKATKVKAISTLSTAITGWVSESILNEQDQKKRAALLKYFIKLADHCVKLNNYSTMRAVLAALDSSTISRLTKTWSHLSTKYKAQLDTMRRLADHAKNSAVYREALRKTTPPAVPFLGKSLLTRLYLTDLTFCREGNPNTRPSPLDPSRPLINFVKYHRLARIVQDVQRFQLVPYNLQPVPEIQQFLSRFIDTTKSTGDLQDLYRRSLILEPRQASDTAPPDTKTGLLGWATRN